MYKRLKQIPILFRIFHPFANLNLENGLLIFTFRSTSILMTDIPMN